MEQLSDRVGTSNGAARGVHFGGDVRMTNLDLVLALVLALGLPFATAWLFRITGGTLAALVLYYGVACVLVVRWRKGTLDYQRPAHWPWAIFVGGLVLVAVITAVNAGTYPNYGAAPLGLALTVLVWAPLNGAMEQLSWQYVLDAWRNRWPSGWPRRLGTAVGIVLILTLVSLIHVLFWILFLPEKSADTPLWITPVLNTLLTVVYIWLYYRSRSMWPTFIIHTLVDLQLVLLANYSILPYL